MQINLKFIVVAGAQEAFGATEFAFDLKGSSAGDLVREIISKYGSLSKRVFLTNGHCETNLQIIVNGRKYVPPERMEDFHLQPGDTIIFTHLVEGG
ncbi:MAG: MoaD/ThiS family protein [Syntrophales bacterium]|jgi:molybdopterin converting factor small subunit|nr:MoaD/ThiS family protein [Syntrophales bacterium]